MAPHRSHRPPRVPAWDSDEDVLFQGTGVAPVAAVAASSDRVFRGLFMPAFDFDVCITVSVHRHGGEMEVVLLDLQGRAWALAAMRKQTGRAEHESIPSRIVQVPLDSHRAAQLARTIDALDREALAARPQLGLDGILLRGAIADAGKAFYFAAWSPRASREPALHAYFAAMFELAVEIQEDPIVRPALERLRGYLTLDDAGGRNPRRDH